MEDMSIHPVNSNVILPVQKAVLPHTVTEDNNEKVHQYDHSEKASGEKEEKVIDLVETVEKVKQFVKMFSTKLTFDVNPETNESVIYVRDKESGKIIRQIPPEEMLKLLSSMNDITGILFNRRV